MTAKKSTTTKKVKKAPKVSKAAQEPDVSNEAVIQRVDTPEPFSTMQGKYRIVEASTLVNLVRIMSKYVVYQLGTVTRDSGKFVQTFIGEVSEEYKIHKGIIDAAKAEKHKALDIRNVEKRAEQAKKKRREALKELARRQAEAGVQDKPTRNFGSGSPVDRDFQGQVENGKIDPSGAQVITGDTKDSPETQTPPEVVPEQGVETRGEGFVIREGDIPADMR